MELGLEGKRALVVAASKGLGYAVARALAAEGARLAIASSNEENIARAARALAAATGAEVAGLVADLADPAGMDGLAQRARAALGGIDILVHNHGGPTLGHAAAIAPEVLARHFAIMLASPIRLTGRVLPEMRARRWGRILVVGAQSMIQPFAFKAMDNVLRPAIAGYVKALANEVAADGVTVNVIMPGLFVTDRVKSSNELTSRELGISEEEFMRRRLAAIPAGRPGRLEDFGALAAFVASERAAYMTGSIFRAEGGVVRSII